MDTNLTQISELIKLLEERDTLLEQITTNILDHIQPTLEVLAELFGKQRNEIEWLDIQHIEAVILIVCALDYNPKQTTDYLTKLFNSSAEFDSSENLKMIRLGIPVSYVFSEKEKLIEFLYGALDDSVIEKIETSVDISEKISDNNSFDISKLTIEQRKQLELFSEHGMDVKH